MQPTKQIMQFDLVVLEELDYGPSGKAVAELPYDVLSTAFDRLMHRCHILEAKGERFRLRDARRRQRRAAGTA